MAEFVAARTYTESILADMLTAVTGSLVGVVANLFTNDVAVDEDTIAADLTAATYTGNGTEAVTFNAVSESDDGVLEVVGIAGEFRPTDAVIPEMVYGYWLVNGAGVFLGAGRFDDGPLPMESALDSIIITPRLRITPSGTVQVVS